MYCLHRLGFAIPVSSAREAEAQGRAVFCPKDEVKCGVITSVTELLSLFVFQNVNPQKKAIGVGCAVSSKALFAVIHGRFGTPKIQSENKKAIVGFLQGKLCSLAAARRP